MSLFSSHGQRVSANNVAVTSRQRASTNQPTSKITNGLCFIAKTVLIGAAVVSGEPTQNLNNRENKLQNNEVNYPDLNIQELNEASNSIKTFSAATKPVAKGIEQLKEMMASSVPLTNLKDAEDLAGQLEKILDTLKKPMEDLKKSGKDAAKKLEPFEGFAESILADFASIESEKIEIGNSVTERQQNHEAAQEEYIELLQKFISFREGKKAKQEERNLGHVAKLIRNLAASAKKVADTRPIAEEQTDKIKSLQEQIDPLEVKFRSYLPQNQNNNKGKRPQTKLEL